MENWRKDQGISNHQVGHWRSSSHNEKPVPLDNRHMNIHSNVMNWVDYAVKEAFDDAKFRFWAENNGFPCNMYIDEADWDNDKEVIKPPEPSYVAVGWRSKEYYGGELHDMYQAGNSGNRNWGTWEANNRSTENSMSWSQNPAYKHDNNEYKMNPERRNRGRGRGRGRGRRGGGRRGRRGNYTPSLL